MSVLEHARRDPYQFDLFHLLRWLENRYRTQPRLARAERLADDPLRLGQVPELAFSPAAVSDCQPGDGAVPARVEVLCFGLFGPQGPLPLHLTEYARERLRNAHDPTFVRFADIFHHRLLSLLYRAWAEAQPTVQYDRPESDRFSVYVGALLGLGTPAVRHRDALPDNLKLYFSGLLACQTRHADGLRQLLEEFLQLPVRLDEFVGRWIDLPPDCWCLLGQRPATSTVGVSAILGDRVWDCSQTFRLVFGPVGLDEYQRLLPGGESLERVTAAVRNYAADEWGWEVKLVLRREEVPPTNMGEQGQLGWTTWLACETRAQDADDLVLRPLPEAA